MKYIVASFNGGTAVALFSDGIVHGHMADSIRQSAVEDRPRNWSNSFEGAGFCAIENGRVRVWGESETMRLKSRAKDAGLIASHLGLSNEGYSE